MLAGAMSNIKTSGPVEADYTLHAIPKNPEDEMFEKLSGERFIIVADLTITPMEKIATVVLNYRGNIINIFEEDDWFTAYRIETKQGTISVNSIIESRCAFRRYDESSEWTIKFSYA